MTSTTKITLWGVRGSAPTANPKFQEYGGHTSCVGIESDGLNILFDSGSGIKDAGNYVMEKGYESSHLFFSHVHLDHIQGFPFYKPVWVKEHSLKIYAGHLKAYGGIQKVISQAFSAPIFPVSMDKLPASISYLDLEPEETITLTDSIMIRSTSLTHPNGATGYRFQKDNKSLCYVTDTEHPAKGRDPNITSLIQGADYFIYDSSFSDEEYTQKKNWGHSTWEEGIRLANEAQVKTLVIFHHDPDHEDEQMKKIEKEALALRPQTIVARQGQILEL